jgi:dephospho-CoA kinase
MYRAALTGNIASGKSAVARTWARLGAAIVDADDLAREAVAPGSAGLAAVVEEFGPDMVRPDGTLDRAALRTLVFADESRRHALEAILHPLIARLRAEADARLDGAGTRIVVHVIPLLFETGMQRQFDDIIVVDAPEAVRLHRLIQQRGMNEVDAQRMIASQMPASTKREQATLVIQNDGTLEQLEAKATAAWRVLETRAGRQP